jgi:hypothetical protein
VGDDEDDNDGDGGLVSPGIASLGGPATGTLSPGFEGGGGVGHAILGAATSLDGPGQSLPSPGGFGGFGSFSADRVDATGELGGVSEVQEAALDAALAGGEGTEAGFGESGENVGGGEFESGQAEDGNEGEGEGE